MEYEVNRYRVASKCPCGKSNRDGKFAPIKGYTDKGKCFSCGEFFPPQEKKEDAFLFPYHCVGIECNLFKFLKHQKKAKEVFSLYKMGCLNGYTLFPYINKNNDIVTAKAILYQSNGRRDRDKPPYFIHKKNVEVKMCLFGEHLVKSGDIVNVCESEKSALIASIVLGGTWVATGGKMQVRLIERLNNPKILYPDNDAIDIWQEYGNIKYSYLQYIKDKPKGYDIGDYCLDLIANSSPSPITVTLPQGLFDPNAPSDLKNMAEKLEALRQILSRDVVNQYSDDIVEVYDVRSYVNSLIHKDLPRMVTIDLQAYAQEEYVVNALLEFYLSNYKVKIVKNY